MTIDELARRVDMTTRNIREWQTNGLLPPPQRRGRIAIYTDDHLSRIERIKSLRTQGFPLDISRRILNRSADSAPEVRRLAAELLGPANLTGTMEMKRVDLADRFGANAEDQLSACGLVDVVDDDLLLITDTATFAYVEKLTEVGLAVSEIARTLIRLAEHQAASVQALVDLHREAIWKPFVDAGLPGDQWHLIADRTIELRSLAIGLGMQTFRRAVDEVGAKAITEEAVKIEQRGR